MNPIISPWLIYFIYALDELKTFLDFLAFTLTMLLLITGLMWFIFKDIGIRKEFDFAKKGKYKMLVFFECVCILINVFIPSKEIIYAMVVVKYVTPNNIEMVGGSVKDSIDYIFEKIDTLTEEEEEK